MNLPEHDIRSMWVKRPKPPYEQRTHQDCFGVHVDSCHQRDGSIKWAIRSGEHDCLGKDGVWIWEPQPSSRDDKYLAAYRWDSLTDAIAFAREHGEDT